MPLDFPPFVRGTEIRRGGQFAAFEEGALLVFTGEFLPSGREEWRKAPHGPSN
jgi:hypothetical protein